MRLYLAVPVIAASSFASALPYCELRLLEGWERDKVLQQERTERRVCLHAPCSLNSMRCNLGL